MSKNRRKNIRVTVTDNDHKVLFSTRTTRGTVTWLVVAAAALLIFITTAVIVWTPVRKLIPGYPSEESRREAVANRIMIDSLENEMQIWDMQITNIRRVVKGEKPLSRDSLNTLRKSEETDGKKERSLSEIGRAHV